MINRQLTIYKQPKVYKKRKCFINIFQKNFPLRYLFFYRKTASLIQRRFLRFQNTGIFRQSGSDA